MNHYERLNTIQSIYIYIISTSSNPKLRGCATSGENCRANRTLKLHGAAATHLTSDRNT